MKFRIERDILADAVAWTARSLPTRPSVPVLAGIFCQARDGELLLSGFDYETSAQVRVPAEVAADGTALVSGRLLADISRSLPPDSVDVSADGGRVELACRGSHFTLQTLPVEEYPNLPEMPTSSGTIRGDALAAAVGQVAIAAGRDDMLPVLTGVRIEIEGSSVTLAATDRYRLAVRELEWSPTDTGISATALVPAKVLADTAKSFTPSADVTVALAAPDSAQGDGIVGFSGTSAHGTRRTTTRLLDGDFPKYRSLFPSEQQTLVRLDTPALVDSLKRVALVAERNTPIRVTLGDGQALLEAGTRDEAQASEAVQAQVDGEPITVGFNPHYLLDGLGVLDAPVTQLAFTQPQRPAVMTGATAMDTEVDGSYRYLLMPVRLQD